eukprot:COSAG02_NODE_1478_length_12404_cov_353.335067_12_plen_81_part_00
MRVSESVCRLRWLWLCGTALVTVSCVCRATGCGGCCCSRCPLGAVRCREALAVRLCAAVRAGCSPSWARPCATLQCSAVC